MKWTKREKSILQVIRKKLASQSHGLNHLINVSQYVLILSKKYNGNRDILVAAALLHDLGRNKPTLHDQKSIDYSIELAKPILEKTDYTQKEIKLILQIILEHDKPFFSSALLESRILKDADFLDGFGFRGLLRAIYYTAEASQPISKAFERINKKMTERFNGLELSESRNIANEQFYLTRLLLSDHQRSGKKLYKGKLIVFEGISGTGKETQSKLLAEYLNKSGNKTEIVSHPTLELKQILSQWRKYKKDSFSEVFFFIADRYNVIQNKIMPALNQGKIVISLRNYISSLVYQAITQYQHDLIKYLYSTFEPIPDAIFYFDLKAEIALSRIEKRIKETGESKGKFEKIKLLKDKRKKYEHILNKYKNVFRLDASKSIDELHKHIVNSLLDLW